MYPACLRTLEEDDTQAFLLALSRAPANEMQERLDIIRFGYIIRKSHSFRWIHPE